MKILSILLLSFLSVGFVVPQTALKVPEAPGVTVERFSWRKEVIIPALLDDPMRPNEEHSDLVKRQKATIRENVIRSKTGEILVPPAHTSPPSRAPGLSSIGYRYLAKVKNTGEKRIRRIEWQYSFLDPETEVEIGQHRYRSYVSVRPGKTADLIGWSTTPPVGVVKVSKSCDGLGSKYSERVVIHGIEYDDGTIWQRLSN